MRKIMANSIHSQEDQENQATQATQATQENHVPDISEQASPAPAPAPASASATKAPNDKENQFLPALRPAFTAVKKFFSDRNVQLGFGTALSSGIAFGVGYGVGIPASIAAVLATATVFFPPLVALVLGAAIAGFLLTFAIQLAYDKYNVPKVASASA